MSEYIGGFLKNFKFLLRITLKGVADAILSIAGAVLSRRSSLLSLLCRLFVVAGFGFSHFIDRRGGNTLLFYHILFEGTTSSIFRISGKLLSRETKLKQENCAGFSLNNFKSKIFGRLEVFHAWFNNQSFYFHGIIDHFINVA